MTAPATLPRPISQPQDMDVAAEPAAIVMLLLDEADAAALLARLEPGELRHLAAAMCAIQDVDAAGVATALHRFTGETERQALPGPGRLQVEQLLTRAVGAARAGGMMRQIAPEVSGRSLEIARWLTPEGLLPLVADEPPHVLAVLLLLLDTEPAARLLALLPDASQALVVERVARLQAAPPAAARELLARLLEERMADRVGAAALAAHGPREAAELINAATGGLAGRVLPAIATRDAALAGAIEEELVTFAMLQRLDAQAMGRLLRDVDNAVLVDGLKGLSEDERHPFLKAMSSRAADGLREEMDARGRVSREDVERARRTMVALARGLADAGEIAFGDGDDNFL